MVAGEAAAAASGALDRAAAVYAECGRTPLAELKSGGVGVREIKRMAKASGVPVDEVPLWLELGYAAELVELTEAGLVPTAGYDRWSAVDPAQRLVTLHEAWWRLTGEPHGEHRAPAPAVLRHDGPGALLTRTRRVLLELLAAQPADRALGDPEDLVEAVLWHLPVAGLGLEPLAGYVSALWREAELLGLVAHRSATAFGRALAAGDQAALHEAARQLLPPPTPRRSSRRT